MVISTISQPFKVCGDKFTDRIAHMSCRLMGFKKMILWEIREALPFYNYTIHFEECSDNPKSLADCTFNIGNCSTNGTQVFLHCKGKILSIYRLFLIKVQLETSISDYFESNVEHFHR